MKVVITCATRESAGEFQSRTALGTSLARLAYDGRMEVRVAPSNTRGLSEVYNSFLDNMDADDIAVFVHDDVWIDDYFLIQRVVEGLGQFDVIGVVGNRRRIPKQASWGYLNEDFLWDEAQYLSGTVIHGVGDEAAVNHYGVSGVACEILDGVFLAAKKSSLVKAGVTFDPRFTFDFYDVDFCRSARERGLKLGTWPICLTHRSAGMFGGGAWRAAYQVYLAKWGS